MKFGRRSSRPAQAPAEPAAVAGASSRPEQAGDRPDSGPFDAAQVDLEHDGVERIDLGGMLIRPPKGLQLRLQVDEASAQVQAVLVGNDEGAVELRAFAAPRNGDLWSDVRRQLAAETSRQGGTATEREGRHGPELQCVLTVRTPDGKTGSQPSRVAGINGPRWFLRATYLGKPAVEPDSAGPWEEAVEQVVVRRGDAAMPPGDPLPLEVPPQARRVS